MAATTARNEPALDAALRLLGSRPHSRRELELKLGRRAYPPADIAAALERVAELGYLDDAAFARALASDRSGRRGSRAIAAELRARGVSRGVIDAALGQLEAASELEAAAALARRRLPRAAGREDQQRVAAALVRRGFDFETARSAVRAAVGEANAGLDGD